MTVNTPRNNKKRARSITTPHQELEEGGLVYEDHHALTNSNASHHGDDTSPLPSPSNLMMSSSSSSSSMSSSSSASPSLQVNGMEGAVSTPEEGMMVLSSSPSSEHLQKNSTKLVLPSRQRNRDFGTHTGGGVTVPHSKYTFSHETQQPSVLTTPTDSSALELQEKLLSAHINNNNNNANNASNATTSMGDGSLMSSSSSASSSSSSVGSDSSSTGYKQQKGVENAPKQQQQKTTGVVDSSTETLKESSSSSSTTTTATSTTTTMTATTATTTASATTTSSTAKAEPQFTQEQVVKQETDDLLASVCAFGEEKVDNEIIDVCLLLHECVQMRKKYILHNPEMDPRDTTLYPWELPEDLSATAQQNEYLLVGSTVSPSNNSPVTSSYDSVPSSPNTPNQYHHHQRHRKRHHQPPTPFDPFDTSIDSNSQLRTNEVFEMKNGIIHVYRNEKDKNDPVNNSMFPPMVSFAEFYHDHKRISRIVYHAPTKSFCYNRLKALELKKALYKNINESLEILEQKQVPHRDFYNVRKVDTHIHLSASMTQKRLVKFIKRKLKECPDEVVIFRDGKKLTLAETFKSLNLTAYDISVDTLDVHANKSVMHRFDKFNLKYNPFGQSRLREIFLKTDNLIGGRYFAELCKETFQDLADSRYQMAEPRVSIYGVNANEWDKLGDWILDNRMYSDHVRWLIQIPRLYYVHRGNNCIKTVQEMLDNIFRPLFEVTRDPASHPSLHAFLKQVVGFDSVDDETKPEPRFHSRLPTPDQWNTSENPPYAYYNYYFYANINALNQYRMSKGLNTFKFRPHCGEAGDPLHLISSYLVADGISHGIELRKTPVLQYLYYLHQIGLAVSPLSNNSLFLDFSRNPLPQFFARGLNVSISTDDPLMFHLCRDPLLEEYSIGAQVWRLNNVDLCEIARYSVLQSGWDKIYKSYWLGENFSLPGVLGNDIHRTNLPNIRLQYRHETLVDEHLFILKCVILNDMSCVNQDERVLTKNSVITYNELMKLIKRTKPLFLKSTERVEELTRMNCSEQLEYEVMDRHSSPVTPRSITYSNPAPTKSKESVKLVSATPSLRSLVTLALPVLAAAAFTFFRGQQQ